MISYFQTKPRYSAFFYLISFIVIPVCSALTYPLQTEQMNKGDYFQNTAAKTLSDSLDFVLKRIRQSLGTSDINLTLGVIKDGRIFLKKESGLLQS
jgi:hypothetical protein